MMDCASHGADGGWCDECARDDSDADAIGEWASGDTYTFDDGIVDDGGDAAIHNTRTYIDAEGYKDNVCAY